MLQHVSLSVVVFVFHSLTIHNVSVHTIVIVVNQHRHTKVWYNKVETHEKIQQNKKGKKKNNNFSVLKLRTSESIYRIHIEFSVSVRELCLYSSSGWTIYTLFCVFLLHFCARTWATIFFIWLEELVENSSEVSRARIGGTYL